MMYIGKMMYNQIFQDLASQWHILVFLLHCMYLGGMLVNIISLAKI